MRLLNLLALTLILLFSWNADLLAQEAEQRHPSYSMTGRDAVPAESPLNPNFLVAEEARLSEGGFWRSAYINEALVGVAVADIDRNGQNEVIYATNRNVYVVRIDSTMGEQMIQLASFSSARNHRILSLDVLDLNGDGNPEIICSAIDETNGRNQSAGFILNYTGGQSLNALATKIPWFMRVVSDGGNRFLAGQRASTKSTAIFEGPIRRLAFSGSGVSSKGSVTMPDSHINVFGFTIGRLGLQNQQMVTAIKYPSEHIFLFDGQVRAWESKEEYGGTLIDLRPPNTEDSDVNRRIFLPSRLLIADIDRDGQNELIVAKNDRGGISFMSNQRAFNSGAIQAFKYNNMSLTPFFRTRSLPGAGVDYQLADFNNNGTQDLIVAVVLEQAEGMMENSRSVLLAYELQ